MTVRCAYGDDKPPVEPNLLQFTLDTRSKFSANAGFRLESKTTECKQPLPPSHFHRKTMIETLTIGVIGFVAFRATNIEVELLGCWINRAGLA